MLPDHDFRIGEKHKLVLSVNAAFLAKEDENGFNWPTLISVRRGKHDKSCPETYSNDFESILQMKEFQDNALIVRMSNYLFLFQ